MNIIFVQPRQQLKSYTDFWQLVGLSGFETCYTDEVDLARHVVYIISPLTVEWCPQVDRWEGKPRAAHLILWNLERPAACGGIGNFRRGGEALLYNRYFDQVWVSDRQLATESGFQFVVLGSHDKLGNQGLRKRYDLAHMSYINDRRSWLLGELDEYKVVPNEWGRKRDKRLRQSRFGLNIHQDQHPYQEPLRLSLFAAFGLPVISEMVYDPYPFTEQTLLMAGYSSLPDKVEEVLNGKYWGYRQIGLATRRLLCHQFRFGDVVRKEVEKSVGNPVFVIGI